MSWFSLVGTHLPNLDTWVKRCSGSMGRFVKDQRGATTLEYALVLIGIFLAIVSAIGFIGDDVQNLFDTTANTLTKFKNR